MILERDVWDYGRLARHLGLNLETVLRMLEYLGYEKDESKARLYRRSSDPGREALRQNIVKEFLYASDPLESRTFYWQVQGRQPPPFIDDADE